MPCSMVQRLLIFSALTLSLGAQAEVRYRIQDLNSLFPGSTNVIATDINNAGWVAGEADRGGAFVLRGGTAHFLPSLDGAALAAPRAINNRGDVTGDFFSGGLSRAYLYTAAGRLVNLSASLPPDLSVNAADIDNAGHVLGDTAGIVAGGFLHDGRDTRLFPFPPGVNNMTPFGFNDHGVIVGEAKGEGFLRGSAFMLDGSAFTLLPTLPDGRVTDVAADINNAGHVIVSVLQGDLNEAYLYRDGEYHRIALPGEVQSAAVDLNERGWAVGQSVFEGDDKARAFLYRNGRTLDLNSLLSAEDANRWLLRTASAINDRGQIVGDGFLNGQFHAFIATPVPEAGSWALMLAGLGMVGWAARARRLGHGS